MKHYSVILLKTFLLLAVGMMHRVPEHPTAWEQAGLQQGRICSLISCHRCLSKECPSCCSQWCTCLLPWATLFISWGLAWAKCTWKLFADLGPKHANANWAVPCAQFIISGCKGKCVLVCNWTICCTTLWGFSSLLGRLIKLIWGSRNISKTAWSNLSTFLCSYSFWPWASRVNGNWQKPVCPTTGSSWH